MELCEASGTERSLESLRSAENVVNIAATTERKVLCRQLDEYEVRVCKRPTMVEAQESGTKAKNLCDLHLNVH